MEYKKKSDKEVLSAGNKFAEQDPFLGKGTASNADVSGKPAEDSEMSELKVSKAKYDAAVKQMKTGKHTMSFKEFLQAQAVIEAYQKIKNTNSDSIQKEGPKETSIEPNGKMKSPPSFTQKPGYNKKDISQKEVTDAAEKFSEKTKVSDKTEFDASDKTEKQFELPKGF